MSAGGILVCIAFIAIIWALRLRGVLGAAKQDDGSGAKTVIEILILCFICAIGIGGFDNVGAFMLAFWPMIILPFVIGG